MIEKYKSLLFNKWRPVLLTGLALFIPLIVYLFNTSILLDYYLSKNALVTFFALVLAWDIAYRAGIGIWVSFLNLKRSKSLLTASKKRKAMDYTLLNDLKTMEKIDKNCSLFGLSGLLLLLVVFPDRGIFKAVLAFSLAITFVSLASLLLVRRVPWLPPDIIEMLERAKFAYVGHAGEKFPHLTPVVQVFDGRNVYFVTSKASKKFYLLKRDPKIALLIDMRSSRDFFGNKAIMIVGEAKIYTLRNSILNVVKLLKVRSLFRKKYSVYMEKYSERKSELPEAWRLVPILKRIPIEIIPEKVVYWRGAKKIKIGL
uniref:pyridoxamine 5'-phosphate oxidase family protein n=1 Tax=Ferroglobus placidus TaxID=54261 RepID=UPI00064EF18F|nr:pyridoxamine 5'-phosphate oxidase family protein [Ferroglobus placidus]